MVLYIFLGNKNVDDDDCNENDEDDDDENDDDKSMRCYFVLHFTPLDRKYDEFVAGTHVAIAVRYVNWKWEKRRKIWNGDSDAW